MISSTFTIDTMTGRIIEFDSQLRKWISETDPQNRSFEDFFELVSYEDFDEFMHHAVEKEGIHTLIMTPKFTGESFDTLVSFVNPAEVDDGMIDLHLIPTFAKYEEHSDTDSISEGIVNTIKEDIFLCSPSGTIRAMNANARDSYSHGNDSIGKKFYEVIQESEIMSTACTLPSALQNKDAYPYEISLPDKNRAIQARVYPFTDENDYYQGFTLFIQGWTAGAADEGAKDTETLNSVIMRVRETAHDVNNIMTVVMGRVQILSFKVQEDELKNNLESVEKAAKESTEKIQKLQEYIKGIQTD